MQSVFELRIVADGKRYEWSQTDMAMGLDEIISFAKDQVSKLRSEGKDVTKIIIRRV